MVLTKCSRCGESFHLRLTGEQALNELHEKENKGEVLCFGCFKELKEYDVVQVVAKNPTVPEAELGDKGTVLLVLNSESSEKGYEAECIFSNGTNKWLGTFGRNQLKWLQSPND